MLASAVTKNKPYEAGQGLSQKARSLAEMLQRHPTLTYELPVYRAVAAPTARPGRGGSTEMTEEAKAGV